MVIGDVYEEVQSIIERLNDVASEIYDLQADRDEADNLADSLRVADARLSQVIELIKTVDEICWRADLRHHTEEQAMGLIRGALAKEDWKRWLRVR